MIGMVKEDAACNS